MYTAQVFELAAIRKLLCTFGVYTAQAFELAAIHVVQTVAHSNTQLDSLVKTWLVWLDKCGVQTARCIVPSLGTIHLVVCIKKFLGQGQSQLVDAPDKYKLQNHPPPKWTTTALI